MYIFMQFLSFVKYIHKIEKTKNSVLSRVTTEKCREKNQNRHLPREKDIFRYMYQVPVNGLSKVKQTLVAYYQCCFVFAANKDLVFYRYLKNITGFSCIWPVSCGRQD